MIIYVCSPYRGEPPHTLAKRNKNLRKAATYSEAVIRAGNIPVTPHLYFAPFLNDADPQDRAIGLKLGLEWLRSCDELWVFGDTVSEGMKSEIALAEQLGKPISYK